MHDPVQGHGLYISQVALVEVLATVCRKARDTNVPLRKRNAIIDLFRQDVRNVYRMELANNKLYSAAGDLCRTYNLRSYDAVQLATAITVRRKLALQPLPLGMVPPQLIFVSADARLLNFARAEGFAVENPNSYP